MSGDGIAILTFDRVDNKVNALNLETGEELSGIMAALEEDPTVKGTVFMSGKPNDFIAGADITMLDQCKDEADYAAITLPSQELFNAIESGKPVVAAIHGTCLGGGMELALACAYRVCTESPRTVMGFPEVQLGLLPGAGGTQRLPKLVGLPAAMPLLLAGSRVRPSKAKRMKLVDVVADPNALEFAAVQAAENLANGTLVPAREPTDLMGKAMQVAVPLLVKLEDMEFNIGGKPTQPFSFVFKKATEGVMKMTHGNYPAPLKIIDVLKTSLESPGGFGSAAGYTTESEGFGSLGVTTESAALRSLFLGSTDCKRNPFPKAKKSPKHVAVIGAGLMGAGVAQVSVQNGYDVTIKDNSVEGLARGVNQIETNLDRKVKRRQMTAFEKGATVSKVVGVTGEGDLWRKRLAGADLVIEAVFESLELKHKVIKELEEVIPKHCVLASNTSAIPIAKLAAGSSRPENFVGMHYFSPVDKMQLLEIITHEGTSQETVSAAFEVGLKQGKIPIVVKDVPGFFVNRCLGPYSDEAVALIQAGAGVNQLNKAMLGFGFPVGPMSLVDEVGIEVAASVIKNLKEDLGIRVGASNTAMLDEAVAAGMLGRKTKKGMFVYEGKSKKDNPEMTELIAKYSTGGNGDISTEEIQLRMASRFVNEAAYCLQDEIIANPTAGDIASVFGIGFPPFRGGPFRMVDQMGARYVVDTMLGFQEAHGDHFAPAQILVDYANTSKKFHA
jgi:enoyl-CoA hydratase/long-chain 3-hydroxyacyl-CoA dehydrogenase